MSLAFVDVREVLELVHSTTAAEVEVRIGDLHIHIRRRGAGAMATPVPATPGAPPPPPAAPSPSPASAPARAVPSASDGDLADCICVTAPMVGVFYEAPSPGAEPFVKVGQPVVHGQDLCILEVMKVMNAIRAPHAGEVVRVGPANGDTVEFGQPLFWIRQGA